MKTIWENTCKKPRTVASAQVFTIDYFTYDSFHIPLPQLFELQVILQWIFLGTDSTSPSTPFWTLPYYGLCSGERVVELDSLGIWMNIYTSASSSSISYKGMVSLELDMLVSLCANLLLLQVGGRLQKSLFLLFGYHLLVFLKGKGTHVEILCWHSRT